MKVTHCMYCMGTAAPEDRAARWSELRRFRERGDWRGALALCSQYHDPLVLWLKPTEDVLEFIGSSMRDLGVNVVVSVGCGSGLLEWMLSGATGLSVCGVEVNRAWWDSKYSPPTFLPLLYTDLGGVPDSPDTNNNDGCDNLCSACVATVRVDVHEGSTAEEVTALLARLDAALFFCYFNDMAAFRGYVGAFRGRCLLLAGPGPGSAAHCQPEPFCSALPAPWTLAGSTRVGSTADYVAIYRRGGRSDS